MSNGEYWQKRFELLEHSQHDMGVQCYANIEKQYRQAQKTLEGQIAAWYQRFATNNGVTLSEAKRMLNAKELAELKWDVNQYIQYGEENAISDTWAKQLENASARFHISRLEALKLQTQQTIEVLFGNQLDSIDSTMRDVYKSGYYHTVFELQKGSGVGWDFSTLDDRNISKVINKPWAADGKNFSERIWGNRQKLVNELHNTLTQNIILGKSPQKSIDEITKKMNTSRAGAGRLIMTEQAFFSSAAQKDCFVELDVEQFEIVATLDSRTSEICRGMDGKHFPMSEWKIGVTAPPFHVNCRSTTVPFFDDDFGAVSERAARDEATGKTYYVPANMTYKQWEQAFVDGDKSAVQLVEPDIKFATKKNSSITAKQKFEDILTVSTAHTKLPMKVKQNLNDTVFEFGYDGSACDILNKTIRVGMGVSEEELFHEYGHLIENYMIDPLDIRKYKEYLVEGLSYSDIMIETYYDSVGNGVEVFLLNGTRFESEYQSRLYISDITEALNPDGTINVDVLGETISEPFRKYMNGEDISDEIRKLIEGVVL